MRSPALVGVRVKAPSFSMPTIWFPLFLLWPIALVIALPCAVFGLAILSLIEVKSAPRFFQCLKTAYVLICEVRGTLVDISSPEAQVFIRVI